MTDRSEHPQDSSEEEATTTRLLLLSQQGDNNDASDPSSSRSHREQEPAATIAAPPPSDGAAGGRQRLENSSSSAANHHISTKDEKVRVSGPHRLLKMKNKSSPLLRNSDPEPEEDLTSRSEGTNTTTVSASTFSARGIASASPSAPFVASARRADDGLLHQLDAADEHQQQQQQQLSTMLPNDDDIVQPSEFDRKPAAREKQAATVMMPPKSTDYQDYDDIDDLDGPGETPRAAAAVRSLGMRRYKAQLTGPRQQQQQQHRRASQDAPSSQGESVDFVYATSNAGARKSSVQDRGPAAEDEDFGLSVPGAHVVRGAGRDGFSVSMETSSYTETPTPSLTEAPSFIQGRPKARSEHLLQAELVENTESVIRGRIFNEAVQAEAVDESTAKRRERRRWMVAIVAAVVAASIAGGIVGSRRNQDSKSPVTLSTKSADATPSPFPSLAPSAAPSIVQRNDYCLTARGLKFQGLSEVIEDDLASATGKTDSIDCSEQVVGSIEKGRWYTFTGNGMPATVQLCADTEQVRTPLIVTGGCGNLSCHGDESLELITRDNNVTIATDNKNCTSLDRQLFLTTERVQYWILVYTNVTLLDDDLGAYRLTVSSNDMCENAFAVSMQRPVQTEQYEGSTLLATMDVGPVPSCVNSSADGPNAAPGVWYRWQGRGTWVNLDLTAENNTEISVFQGPCGSLECVKGEYDSPKLHRTVAWFAEENETYVLLVRGRTPDDRGSFKLGVSERAKISQCEQGDKLGPASADFHGSFLDADVPRGGIASVSCSSNGKVSGVWYKLVGSGYEVSFPFPSIALSDRSFCWIFSSCFMALCQVNLHVCKSLPNTAKISVYNGTSCNDATCRVDIVDNGCGNSMQRNGTTWFAGENATYFVFVYDFGAGSFIVSFEPLLPSAAPFANPTTSPTPNPTPPPTPSLPGGMNRRRRRR